MTCGDLKEAKDSVFRLKKKAKYVCLRDELVLNYGYLVSHSKHHLKKKIVRN
jgi:hypothetical protein